MVNTNSTFTAMPKMMMALTLLASAASFAVANVSTLANVNFARGTEGFRYYDDTFRGTKQPHYASGAHKNSRINVALGGRNNNRINNMSGGYRRDYALTRDAKNVKVMIRYGLEVKPNLDSNEIVFAMASFGGKVCKSSSRVDYMAYLRGHPHSRAVISGRYSSYNLGPFKQGRFPLILGAYLNTKNGHDEEGLVYYNSVIVQVEYASTPAPTPAPTPPRVTTTTLLNAKFAHSTSRFVYEGNFLKKDKAPTYAVQSHEEGRLCVTFGGVDQSSVSHMQGYWGYNVVLPRDMKNVQVSLAYELEVSPQVHEGSIVQAKAYFGNKAIGSGGFVAVLRADKDDSNIRTPLKTLTVNLGAFSRGTHKLFLGGYMSFKDSEYEETRVWYSSAKVVGTY